MKYGKQDAILSRLTVMRTPENTLTDPVQSLLGRWDGQLLPKWYRVHCREYLPPPPVNNPPVQRGEVTPISADEFIYLFLIVFPPFLGDYEFNHEEDVPWS